MSAACSADAIAHEAHHVPFGLQRTHDAFLVQWGELGKDLVLQGGGRQGFVAHRFDLRAQQDLVCGQADLTADMSRHDLVVARQHLDSDAVLGERLQRWRGGFLGRVQEGDVACQGQLSFVNDRIGGLAGRHLFHGHGDYAQAILVECVRDLLDPGQHGRIKRRLLGDLASFNAYFGAHGQDLFECALADQFVVVIAFGDHHGHSTPLEVERDFVDFSVVLLQFQFERQLHMIEHGAVKQVFQPSLVVLLC